MCEKRARLTPLRCEGNLGADGTRESDDIDHDTGDVGGERAEVEPARVVVDAVLAERVQVGDLDPAADDKEVVRHHDTADRREEDAVRRQVLQDTKIVRQSSHPQNYDGSPNSRW